MRRSETVCPKCVHGTGEMRQKPKRIRRRVAAEAQGNGEVSRIDPITNRPGERVNGEPFRGFESHPVRLRTTELVNHIHTRFCRGYGWRELTKRGLDLSISLQARARWTATTTRARSATAASVS